jgi:hypothetical protein
LCWLCHKDELREAKAAAEDRAVEAEARLLLEQPIAETARLRRRVETAARIRHEVWRQLPSANGNRAELVAFEGKVTAALRERWELVRAGEARDRRSADRDHGFRGDLDGVDREAA